MISAAGYSNLTVELTAGGNDGYTAKIKDSGDGGEDGEDSGPAGEKEVPPTNLLPVQISVPIQTDFFIK